MTPNPILFARSDNKYSSASYYGIFALDEARIGQVCISGFEKNYWADIILGPTGDLTKHPSHASRRCKGDTREIAQECFLWTMKRNGWSGVDALKDYKPKRWKDTTGPCR